MDYYRPETITNRLYLYEPQTVLSCDSYNNLSSKKSEFFLIIREMQESIDFIRHTVVLVINKRIKYASRIF